MEGHYTYLNSITDDPNQQKFITAVLLGAILVGLGITLTRKLRASKTAEAHVVPDRKFSLFGICDLFIEFFVAYHDSILGKENRRFVPFTGSIFVYIFLGNIIGLIPGVPAITTTVWVTTSLAFVSFFYFNIQGIKANGLMGYIKHFFGPIPTLIPSFASSSMLSLFGKVPAFIGVLVLLVFFFSLEIFSTCLRILTLNLRLYWNVTADHIILGIFTDLVPFLLPVVFLVLGTFVSFMQAFIFTTLNMVYILLATQHEEEH